MKKISSLLFIVLLIISIYLNVYASNNVSIESISLVEKSDDLIELSKPTTNGMNLGFNLSFLNIGDKAKYEIIISNNSNKDYYINNETRFNKSNYISYTYEFNEKVYKIEKNSKLKMYITIEYTSILPPQKLVNGMYTEDNAMSIDLSDVIITNPATYSNIIVFILIITILLIVTIIKLKKKQKIGTNLLLIGLLLIPITTYALETITIKAETKITIEKQRNIIESRYENPNSDIYKDFWQYSSYIRTITFETQIKEPSNYAYKFDVSEEKNNSIIAYLVERTDNSSYFDLYIMSNGYIYANPESSIWFDSLFEMNEINNIENFKTNYVRNMDGMFARVFNMEELDLSSFNTSNVTSMAGMFSSSLGSSGGGILKRIIFGNWDTSKVTNMANMFYLCAKLESLDLSSFDTSNVTDMFGMFSNCEVLESLDLSGFDTSNVDEMTQMFGGDKSLKTIYAGTGWNTNKVDVSKEMFGGCTSLVGGKGTKFDSEIIDATRAKIDGGKANPGYFTAKK